MHLFDSKKGILRSKNGLVFKPMPQSAAFYLSDPSLTQTIKYLYGGVSHKQLSFIYLQDRSLK
jgi:hypothetical protein